MNQNNASQGPKREFEAINNKEYEFETIIDSTVYGKEANNQIPGFYYLVLWKGYLEEENTWEPSAAVKYLRKLINTFYKQHLKKSIAISLPLNFALPIAKPTIPKK